MHNINITKVLETNTAWKDNPQGFLEGKLIEPDGEYLATAGQILR